MSNTRTLPGHRVSRNETTQRLQSLASQSRNFEDTFSERVEYEFDRTRHVFKIDNLITRLMLSNHDFYKSHPQAVVVPVIVELSEMMLITPFRGAGKVNQRALDDQRFCLCPQWFAPEFLAQRHDEQLAEGRRCYLGMEPIKALCSRRIYYIENSITQDGACLHTLGSVRFNQKIFNSDDLFMYAVSVTPL